MANGAFFTAPAALLQGNRRNDRFVGAGGGMRIYLASSLGFSKDLPGSYVPAFLFRFALLLRSSGSVYENQMASTWGALAGRADLA